MAFIKVMAGREIDHSVSLPFSDAYKKHFEEKNFECQVEI